MIRLYNTLSRRLEEFVPRRDRQVGFYACGPTVYSTAHLGNLRTYVFEDVLRRTLEFNGYKVKHVMNVTDVGHLTDDADMGEDKIEQAARREHKSAWEIAKEHEAEFFRDLARLNIVPPTTVLRATDTIDLQIALIKRLEKKGVTYLTSDGVYFDTTKFPRYGQLSGQAAGDKQAGARVAVNSEKHQPSDFALWKFSKPEDKRQMEWPSPWGIGFPGWHIECSAMSMKELGEQFAIHAGGVDHIAVHHENEIAQSEAATGKHPFVKYWLHGEFLILPGKRMGKSEGNAITLQDIVDRGITPLAYRYLCLQTHYRSILNFTWDSIQAADTGLHRLWDWVGDQAAKPKIGCAEFEGNFMAAVNDDLDTPKALAIVHQLLASDYPPAAKLKSLSIMDRLLGLDLTPAAAAKHVVQPSDKVRRLLENRERARRAENWTEADRIRAAIEGQGFRIDDTPSGPRLRKV